LSFGKATRESNCRDHSNDVTRRKMNSLFHAGKNLPDIEILAKNPSGKYFEFIWACGPPIDMKIGLSLCCMLTGRGRHRSDYALDEVRPFLSLIGDARFEPIYAAPSLRVGRVVARDGV